MLFLLVTLLECLDCVTGLIKFGANFNAKATADSISNLIVTVTGKYLGREVLN